MDDGAVSLTSLCYLLSQNPHSAAAKSLQSCPTPCNPTDCSLPGSSSHGIFQARVLEWVAIAFPNPHTAPGLLSSSG